MPPKRTPFLGPRVDVDLRRRGIPSVPVIGRYSYTRANAGLRDHRHPGALEICYLVRGRQTYLVGGRRYCLRGGDIFMTYPDEEHGTGGEPEEKGVLYWMTILHPSETGGSLLGLASGESRVLWKALADTSRRHFPGLPEMKAHLDALMRMLRLPAAPLSRVEWVNRLVAFLLDVVAARSVSLDRDGWRRFRDVFAHIEARLDRPEELTVAKLAAIAGLSSSRFKARFKEDLGIPPAEYALRARIEEAARRLVEPGATVTGVAFALGFSSSQYFASAFRRFTNTTPRETIAAGRARRGGG